MPIFIGELILGRSSKRAAVGAYDTLSQGKSSWKIAGWLGVSASFLIMSYYSVIGGWGISYVLMSLIGSAKGMSVNEVVVQYQDLSHSPGISIMWHFIFTFCCMAIVLIGVRKGIEFWSKIMTRTLLVLLLALFFYCITLDGFGQAVSFIFKPDLSRFKPSSLLEGLGLAFFTLSLGQGIMISFGSYMKKDTSVVKMSMVVAASVLIVAILAALIIFPVLFSFPGKAEGGIGLVFETLPYLFTQLPGSLIIATAFFVLFVFAGITSAIPLIEVVSTNYMELYNMSRKKAVTIVSIICFLFGIPSAYAFSGGFFPGWDEIYGKNFFRTMDSLVTVWIIPLAGLLGAIFMGWVLDKQKAYDEFGEKYKGLFFTWRFFVRWVVPCVIVIIVLQKSGVIDVDRILNIETG